MSENPERYKNSKIYLSAATLIVTVASVYWILNSVRAKQRQ
jgi:hypothetical protein